MGWGLLLLIPLAAAGYGNSQAISAFLIVSVAGLAFKFISSRSADEDFDRFLARNPLTAQTWRLAERWEQAGLVLALVGMAYLVLDRFFGSWPYLLAAITVVPAALIVCWSDLQLSSVRKQFHAIMPPDDEDE